MKFTGAVAILMTLGVVSAYPTADRVIPPLAPNAYNVSTTDVALIQERGELAALGCIIRSYSGSNCKGTNLQSYDYSTQGCRSCRPFDTSHSFSMSGTCPDGRFYASDNNCGKSANNPTVGFNGAGCYNVNTGRNWVSGWPCFTG